MFSFLIFNHIGESIGLSFSSFIIIFIFLKYATIRFKVYKKHNNIKGFLLEVADWIIIIVSIYIGLILSYYIYTYAPDQLKLFGFLAIFYGYYFARKIINFFIYSVFVF
mgnify:FL=1